MRWRLPTWPYDRTLLASARNISERITLTPEGVRVDVPYISLDTFEVGMNATMFYRVSGVDGEFVSGYDDLPPFDASQPRTKLYPALVSFYDRTYRGQPIRIAALRQPVMDASGTHGGMALIEVGETLDSRQALTRNILFDVLWGQLMLVLAVVLVIWLFTRRALAPLDALRAEVAQRQPGATTPLPLDSARARNGAAGGGDERLYGAAGTGAGRAAPLYCRRGASVAHAARGAAYAGATGGA
ncbi:sensor histidine kinase N-terminal domain-containing protein [Cupriavidus basilensis]